MKYRVVCPAKINEFLAVGLPDERQYHPVETVMQAVSLGDILEIEVGIAGLDDVQFSRAAGLEFDWEPIPSANTITKALLLLRTRIDLPAMRVEVQKFVPTESGLGGGSSDAAGILRFAQFLHPEALSDATLAELASMIGADVTFFLHGGRALATGFGEQIRPLNDLPTRWMVIARPGVGCSTRDMYMKLDATERPLVTYRGDVGHNDFERVAPCESLELLDRLRSVGAVIANLTGSGSATFGFFTNERAAQWAANRLEEEGVPFVRVACTVPRMTDRQHGIFEL
ncbi:MAG: 4-(cytidine 5'-diphospho)-2-C-methyl-D-erythritol kinase [Fimbriimonadaceae bacterium]|nr:4-(cytidine 5'-diphospho)-2-C-methyl-D-erythritol kinase [Fimbriimonadaceae bacterium]